jgi:hypothetical protein
VGNMMEWLQFTNEQDVSPVNPMLAVVQRSLQVRALSQQRDSRQAAAFKLSCVQVGPAP